MAKPKRRVVEVDPELVKEFEELKHRVAESKIREAATLARTEEFRKWLKILASNR